jgi:hypothetical protein
MIAATNVSAKVGLCSAILDVKESGDMAKNLNF